MKRLALALTATAPLALALALAVSSPGCTSEGQTVNSPFAKKPAGSAAKSPTEANYFEMKKEGKTYVFSKIDSMNAFREGGAAGKTRTEQLDGKTVVFEDRSYMDYNRLVAEYKRAHNIQ